MTEDNYHRMKKDPTLTTINEIANRFRLSRHAVYAWIRKEVIPPSAIARIGSRILVQSDILDELSAERKLGSPQRNIAVSLEGASVTTRGPRERTEHRFTDDNGNVLPFHPWSPNPLGTSLDPTAV